MTGTDTGIVASLLRRLGLPEGLLSPLLAHAREVRDQSDRLGLVSAGDRNCIVSRHTTDSLLFALARAPVEGERWVDAGSGAGFPGMVLACCYPGTQFTLAEPKRRRAGFLDLQAAGLGLGNVSVEVRPVESLKPGFDVAVARAMTSPEETLSALLGAVRPGGLALAAVGPRADTPAGATRVQIEGIDQVDSPGLLFMIARTS